MQGALQVPVHTARLLLTQNCCPETSAGTTLLTTWLQFTDSCCLAATLPCCCCSCPALHRS